jgi:hypothetical protein
VSGLRTRYYGGVALAAGSGCSTGMACGHGRPPVTPLRMGIAGSHPGAYHEVRPAANAGHGGTRAPLGNGPNDGHTLPAGLSRVYG